MLRVAVMADTHDNVPLIKRAVKKINKLDVKLAIHCGDFSAPFAVDPYRALEAPMISVYGNNDAEKELIRGRLNNMGKEVKGRFAFLDVEGVKVAVTHGDEADLLTMLEGSGVNLILHGHTHRFEVKHVEDTVVLNPGEVCGYLTGKPTLALVELPKMEVKMIKL
ncbi:MAG: metallophosphoesterase [Candidatus Bathyarchaeia archaeon]